MTNQEAIAILSELKKCYLGGIVDALDFAIEAVKAQEPKLARIEGGDMIQVGYCQNCGKLLQPWGANYCYNCGRKVKWE